MTLFNKNIMPIKLKKLIDFSPTMTSMVYVHHLR